MMQSQGFDTYQRLPGTWDEFSSRSGIRPLAGRLLEALGPLDPHRMRQRQALVDAAFVQAGVTFSVYSDARGEEKIFPFDLIPRVIAAAEWRSLERGLEQRVVALNAFLRDVYTDRKIVRDGVVPEAVLAACTGYEPLVQGIVPPGGIWVHISGIDLVRGGDGTFLVLEDNLRCPSGVSYVLENRALMRRVFPAAFEALPVASVEAYPIRLQRAMRELGPLGADRPVVLTPGRFNSAYFEHGFLARRAGAELVEGSDLVVEEERVHLKTTRGLEPIDVIYRRVDDAFLDPRAFRPDSMLGVPGLFSAYAKGNVTLMNAIGNGVADDKAMYPFVPAIIRYYLGEDAILQQVPTYRCVEPASLSHVLANLETLVVKRVDGAGGYGMLFGPSASRAEREAFADQLRAHPEQYIAQPVVELSTCPVVDGERLRPCRVDLRPYIIMQDPEAPWVLPGGLTRVALAEGSYIVNSSQGGGSKDTWVLTEDV